MQMIIFIIANMLNVVMQTAKNIVTIKGSKLSAALINAAAFSFYTYILILISDGAVSTTAKCIIVGFCNLVGVYFVKLAEERAAKDKLWEIKIAASNDIELAVGDALCNANISFGGTKTDTDDYTIYKVYCETKEETAKVKAIVDKYHCKTFVTEQRMEL